jgi:hypothetical protein
MASVNYEFLKRGAGEPPVMKIYFFDANSPLRPGYAVVLCVAGDGCMNFSFGGELERGRLPGRSFEIPDAHYRAMCEILSPISRKSRNLALTADEFMLAEHMQIFHDDTSREIQQRMRELLGAEGMDALYEKVMEACRSATE